MSECKKILSRTRGITFFLIIVSICILVLNKVFVVNQSNIPVIFMFVLNGIFIIPNMIRKSNHGYSIEEMIWVFMFLFMFLAPVVQFCLCRFPWWNSGDINVDIVFRSNLVVFAFIVIFIVCNMFFKSVLQNKKQKDTSFYYKNIKLVLDISFYASVIMSAAYIKNVGFINLFARSTNGFNAENTAIAQIASSMCCALPAITLSLHMYYKRINGHIYNSLHLIISLFLTVILNFPTGRARYQCAVIYIGLLILCKKNFSNKYIFKLLIIFGMILLFPILNFFRYNTFDNISQLFQYKINFSDDLLKGDYDSFSMLCRCLIYKDRYGISYGNQILGNILFFIPRSVWPDKPIGSGAMVTQRFGWEFTNVSCPYIGEGYINFGVAGVILFAVVLSYACIYCQSEWDKSLNDKEKKFKPVNVIYPFILGFSFFIMRGDLLSSFSYLIGFCVPAVSLLVIDFFVRKITNQNK